MNARAGYDRAWCEGFASGLDDLDGHEAGDIFQMVIREVERPLLEVVMNH
ncbi:MAG: hypothetical protein ACREYE_25745 [Gammaproteobacteria bacterium]